MKKKHNLTEDQIKLFETLKVKDVALILNVSPKTAQTLKKRFRPDLVKKLRKHSTQELECRLKDAISTVPINTSFNISKFCNKFEYNQCQISSYLCELVANKYGLDYLKRSTIIEHNYSNYSRKLCSCDICKLNASVYQRYKVRKIYLSNKQVAEWVSIYKDLYDNDKSRYKKVFYSIMDKEVAKLSATEIATKY